MYADIRYRPPKWICNAGEGGELPVEVLVVWKATVERLDSKFNYGAGVKVWRSKCAKEGIELGRFAAGGRQSPGDWRHQTGDKIETWCKNKLAEMAPKQDNAWDRLNDSPFELSE